MLTQLLQTAIAGSVDLRCYCLAESRRDGRVGLSLPDLQFDKSWDIESIPWNLVTPSAKAPRAGSTPDASLVAALSSKFVDGVPAQAAQAAVAFLYLYLNLAEHQRYV